MKVKVQEHSDLVRDMASNAILNINNDALNAYKKRKSHLSKVNVLEDKVILLENKMDEILTLLKQTINTK